jgi:hypothetical protein
MMTKEEMTRDIKNRDMEHYMKMFEGRNQGIKPYCEDCDLFFSRLDTIKEECSDCLAYKEMCFQWAPVYFRNEAGEVILKKEPEEVLAPGIDAILD